MSEMTAPASPAWPVFLAIHAVVPAAGVAVYIWLLRRMRAAGVPAPPDVALFMVFATYGGLLLVVLTASFLSWSGAASLGFGYLALAAPFVMAGTAFNLRERRTASPYHAATFLAAAGYVPVLAACLAAGSMLYGAD